MRCYPVRRFYKLCFGASTVKGRRKKYVKPGGYILVKQTLTGLNCGFEAPIARPERVKKEVR